MAAENLLLLPGMMCDARMWQAQIDSLGVLTSIPLCDEFDNFADAATAILDSAPQQFALAGLSMGGILAFEIWRQAPQRVSHLALIDTNPFAESPERQSLRLTQIEQVVNGGLRSLAIDSLKPMYLAESNRDDEALLNTILDMAMDLGPEVFRLQSLALKNRVDSSEILQQIDCPVSVLCGAEDTLCPVAYHEYMADKISDCKLVVIDECGHLASMEKPEIITQELRELFARDSRSGKTYAQQSG
jgi:pimeloyl-ACP methyl ester carboxylesterase